MIDWNMFWTAILATSGILTLAGSLFAFIRNHDMKTTDRRLQELSTQMTSFNTMTEAKLSEVEFRRFETKYEHEFQRFEDKHNAALHSLQASTNCGLEKLDSKLDEKFDKLFTLLIDKK